MPFSAWAVEGFQGGADYDAAASQPIGIQSANMQQVSDLMTAGVPLETIAPQGVGESGAADLIAAGVPLGMLAPSAAAAPESAPSVSADAKLLGQTAGIVAQIPDKIAMRQNDGDTGLVYIVRAIYSAADGSAGGTSLLEFSQQPQDKNPAGQTVVVQVQARTGEILSYHSGNREKPNDASFTMAQAAQFVNKEAADWLAYWSQAPAAQAAQQAIPPVKIEPSPALSQLAGQAPAAVNFDGPAASQSPISAQQMADYSILARTKLVGRQAQMTDQLINAAGGNFEALLKIAEPLAGTELVGRQAYLFDLLIRAAWNNPEALFRVAQPLAKTQLTGRQLDVFRRLIAAAGGNGETLFKIAEPLSLTKLQGMQIALFQKLAAIYWNDPADLMKVFDALSRTKLTGMHASVSDRIEVLIMPK